MQLDFTDQNRTWDRHSQFDKLLRRIEMMGPGRTAGPPVGRIRVEEDISRLGARMTAADGRQRCQIEQTVSRAVLDVTDEPEEE